MEGSCCSVLCLDTCWFCSLVNKSDGEYFMTLHCMKFDSCVPYGLGSTVKFLMKRIFFHFFFFNIYKLCKVFSM